MFSLLVLLVALNDPLYIVRVYLGGHHGLYVASVFGQILFSGGLFLFWLVYADGMSAAGGPSTPPPHFHSLTSTAPLPPPLCTAPSHRLRPRPKRSVADPSPTLCRAQASAGAASTFRRRSWSPSTSACRAPCSSCTVGCPTAST